MDCTNILRDILTIQRFVRGFLVRKRFKKLSKIRKPFMLIYDTEPLIDEIQEDLYNLQEVTTPVRSYNTTSDLSAGKNFKNKLKLRRVSSHKPNHLAWHSKSQETAGINVKIFPRTDLKEFKHGFPVHESKLIPKLQRNSINFTSENDQYIAEKEKVKRHSIGKLPTVITEKKYFKNGKRRFSKKKEKAEFVIKNRLLETFSDNYSQKKQLFSRSTDFKYIKHKSENFKLDFAKHTENNDVCRQNNLEMPDRVKDMYQKYIKSPISFDAYFQKYAPYFPKKDVEYLQSNVINVTHIKMKPIRRRAK